MEKQCIFHINKNCDGCNECDVCDLDQNKICDSCGDCLEITNNDYKKVIVDDIYESKDFEEEDFSKKAELRDYRIFNEDYKYLDTGDDEDLNVEFIEDIEGLSELLEDTENTVLEEISPGLFVLKDPKK